MPSLNFFSIFSEGNNFPKLKVLFLWEHCTKDFDFYYFWLKWSFMGIFPPKKCVLPDIALKSRICIQWRPGIGIYMTQRHCVFKPITWYAKSRTTKSIPGLYKSISYRKGLCLVVNNTRTVLLRFLSKGSSIKDIKLF